MFDPIVNFFTRIFQWIGRGIGLVIGVILWPFLGAGRWYTQRGWTLKAAVGLGLADQRAHHHLGAMLEIARTFDP